MLQRSCGNARYSPLSRSWKWKTLFTWWFFFSRWFQSWKKQHRENLYINCLHWSSFGASTGFQFPVMTHCYFTLHQANSKILSGSPEHVLKIWACQSINKYIHKISSFRRLLSYRWKQRGIYSDTTIKNSLSELGTLSDTKSSTPLLPPSFIPGCFYATSTNINSLGAGGACHPWVSNHYMDFATTCTHTSCDKLLMTH